jgi:hypothetical protein
MESELASAVANALEAQGDSVRQVRDGDCAGFDADRLLLLVNVANFPAYRRMLPRATVRRPRTILWQMDPLPPEETPEAVEQIGLNAAGWRDRLRAGAIPPPASTVSGQVMRLTAKFRHWTYKQLSRPGYTRALQAMLTGPGWRWPDVDWPQIRACFQAWHWIRSGLAEGWIDRLAVSTQQRQRFLDRRHCPSAFLPVPAYPALGHRLELTRDIDVLFLGRTRHGRRPHLWPRLHASLQHHPLRVLEITGDCYGTARTELLNRTRVLVNLHNYPWNPAWIRFHIATLCGAAIASEPVDDTEPYAPGRDYLAASVSELPAAIARLLHDETERQHLVHSANRICQTRLTLPATMDQLRQLVPGRNGPNTQKPP